MAGRLVYFVLTKMNDRTGSIKTFGDLFCGVGGFHLAARELGLKCAYACDIWQPARECYASNFGLTPAGDITQNNSAEIPKFDLLCAGFPCQPFSIIGDRKGMADPRGTLFFEIVRVAEAKSPQAMILENVRQLTTIQGGKVFDRILSDIDGLGYTADWRILNALNFGLPQKRERVLIVATKRRFENFPWPEKKLPMRPLADILEKTPDSRHFVSDKIRKSRIKSHKSEYKPGIWHENKGGNISSHPFSCALRAGASYNYLLVDGERRLTPREMFRLQGFPEKFKIVGSDAQVRRQAGNAVPVPMIKEVIKGILEVYGQTERKKAKVEGRIQAA